MNNETKKSDNNIAFIDGQNLFLGTNRAEDKWNINLAKFRIYLEKKYLNKKRGTLSS